MDVLKEKKAEDWIIVSDDKALSIQAEDYFRNVIINPGCVYFYDEAFAFNVKARSLNGFIDMPEIIIGNIYGLYPADKIISVGRQIPFGRKFAIYGAGNRGKTAMDRLGKDHWHNSVVTAWVDTYWENRGFPVQNPEVLKIVEYDYVLVAVEDQRIYSSIYKRICELGIKEEKILWTMAICW